jgi:hypothetical protein
VTADPVREYADAIKIVDAKKPLGPTQCQGLAARIRVAVMVYRGTHTMADYASKITIQNIAVPLDEVIEVLEDDEVDGHAVLVALGAPQHMMVSPDRESLNRALEEREILLHLLRKLRNNLPPAPTKRGRGKPKAHDLHNMVGCLADIWKDFTEEEFTQRWHKKEEWEPISAAAQFVYAVVSTVDPERLPSLPEVTEQVVKRRRATSDK